MNEELFKRYGLEERTYQFASRVRTFVKKIPKAVANIEDGKQLVRSSGSAAANFIEAVEAISKKDYLYRIKVCRKESKESNLWLKLIDVGADVILETEKHELTKESYELACIFGSIVNKTSINSL